MREANEERKRQIDLQKAQYELERMQNQRTILQYSEEKGMHYVQDTSGIRDAKQAVDDAQLEIDIAKKEKEISLIEDEIELLEKQKDAIQDQIEALDKQAESIEKYYDKLIKEQEKMFDSMIKNLENQKSKWEELAEIQEIAEAYAAVKQAADDLGYSVEDLLNGNEAAFEDFKSRYIAIMSDCGQNTAFQDGLEYASGVAKESFGSIVNDSKEVKDALTEIGTASSELEPVAKAIESIGTSSSTASTNTSQIADDMSTLNTNTTGLSDNLTGISDALSGMPEAEKFDAIATAFTNLGEAIKGVATALGVGEKGTVGGLVGALQEISTLSLDGAGTGGAMGADGSQGQGAGQGATGGGIISQFNLLKKAVDDVTAAIGGGTGGSGGGEGTGGESGSAGSASSGGLINAINEFKSATDAALGGGGGADVEGIKKGTNVYVGTPAESSAGGSGAIPQFEQLKGAVDNVTTSIGTGEEDGEKKDASTLTGAITGLGETTKTIVGTPEQEETITGRFQQMSNVLGEADKHVTGISDGLTAIDGQEVECTIKVNIETTGGLPVGLAKSTGTALDTMNLESAEYNAKYGKAHAEGTALVSGNWAVQSDEKNALLGELGYEIIVRNGRFFTVGENGAEMFPIKKGDIVFNHEQSVQLLKNGHISGRGKAYANGTVNDGTVVTSNGTVLRPLQPGDKDYELLKKFEAYHEQFKTQIIPPVNAINKNTELITKSINNVNNRSTQQQISFSTGDIIVQGVQNVDGFAKAVKTHFPNAMLQAIHKR